MRTDTEIIDFLESCYSFTMKKRPHPRRSRCVSLGLIDRDTIREVVEAAMDADEATRLAHPDAESKEGQE